MPTHLLTHSLADLLTDWIQRIPCQTKPDKTYLTYLPDLPSPPDLSQKGLYPKYFRGCSLILHKAFSKGLDVSYIFVNVIV